MLARDIFLKIYEKALTIKGPQDKKSLLKGMVFAVINQKGGCGKTTTAINLSACLAESGKKVLLIDADPQGHATLGLGFKLNDREQNLYHVLLRPEIDISSIVRETYHAHLHLVPSHAILVSAQVDLINIVGREGLLKHKLNSVRPKYDIIVIDCPPSLNLLTVNALVAADKVIIPVQTHYYSLDGMRELFDTIAIVKRDLNPQLGILGVVPTLFDRRTKINHQVLKALREYFANGKNNIKIFDSVIHNSVSLTESPIYGKPVIRYKPKSRGAEDYWNLTREILSMEAQGG